MTESLDLQAVQSAHERIRPFIHRTPVLTSDVLDELTGAKLFFKCENFQRVGAFKARGAFNAVLLLSEAEARGGVATHSSGNHAAALSLAARTRGIPARIVMPNNSNKAKQASVLRYGGQIIFCEPTLQAREQAAARIVAETGATMIHPYNNLRVMAGQGTAALELLEDVPDLDTVIAPVSGGGLLAGTAVAVKSTRPQIEVIAAEPLGADDTSRSFQQGSPAPLGNVNTVADGLRALLGDLVWPIVRERVSRVICASEPGIISATRLMMEVMKIVVEPSSAVCLAAILENKIGSVRNHRIGIILSGGNIDFDELPWARK
jgi:threonine dehydratase